MNGINRRSFIKTGVTAAAATTQALKAAEQKSFRDASEAGRGIKVACSTRLWQGAPLEKALAGISGAGYEWVEADSEQLTPYREDSERLKKLLGPYGLGLAAASVSGNFVDRDERLKNISNAVLTARVLQAMGSGVIVLESTGWGKITREPQNYHVFSTNLSEIGALVYEETGLHSAYRFNEQDAADIRKLIATSDSRYVKFCFDTQYLTRLGVDPVPMIQTYGPRVLHVDLRDGKGKGANWEDVPLGKGAIKLPAVMDALCQARYNGWVSIHQDHVSGSPDKTAASSLKKVQAHIKTAERKQAERDAAEGKDAPVVAENNGHQGHIHAAPDRQSTLLGGLVMIGAAAHQPWNFFMQADQANTDKSNPMQGMTDGMHANHMSHVRTITPLPPQDPYFKPLFFSAEAYRDVSALVDAIIPVTETPGALAARADEYADLMIWLDQDQQATAKERTARFRQAVTDRYHKSFAELSSQQKTEFLAYLTGKSVAAADRPAAQFFNQIRGLAVHAYYTSPQGLIEDLGYKGNTYVTEFVGCTHPEHQA
ncbi:MAG TPA: TIM barrel protein [Bryobacteraceae bacterium]|nr:TIM barrel protein [Bryobacteraceae bacterium]